MKHIKKKYLSETKPKLKDGANGFKLDRTNLSEIKKYKKNTIPFIEYDGKFIWSTFYNYNGKMTILPLPSLSLVYYNSAYFNNIQRAKMKLKLFEKITIKEKMTEDASNEIYNYFGYASMTIIGMFTSIEAFVNQIIPDDGQYIKSLKNKTEIYTKNQIQEHFNFWDKIKKVLPHFYKKNFFSKPTKANTQITNLKELRDEIIHTKSEIHYKTQEELTKRLLNFKFDECLLSIRTFMNFYVEDFIEECECGNEY